MKRILLSLLCLLALTGVLAARNSAPLAAEIPFPFFVGDERMQAGDYSFVFDQNNYMVLIRAQEPRRGVFVSSFPAAAPENGERSLVVFTKYGDGRYFLRQVVHAGDPTACETSKSKTERESVTSSLHAGNRPAEVVIVAKAAE